MSILLFLHEQIIDCLLVTFSNFGQLEKEKIAFFQHLLIILIIHDLFNKKSFPARRNREHVPWAHLLNTFRIKYELGNTNARSHT